MKKLLSRLSAGEMLSAEEFTEIIRSADESFRQELYTAAANVRKLHYGTDVYVRGLIEFTNYCKNNCLYCGIRAANRNVERYRLTEEQILACCEDGYQTGFRTFVLQGGEDPFFTPEKIARIVSAIKERYPDCAVTLSVGDHTKETYRLWKEAGADRYLLRHETADALHYGRLHPKNLTLEHRIRCLYHLKELDYQVGCGFMVGSPFQTFEHLAKDLLFLWEFQPHMVGIGPFIPHKDTPFRGEAAGTLELTLTMVALTRLLLPGVLLPATTALGSIHPTGRELGVLAGANVCMPNLSPEDVRDKYTLYNNKLHTGAESARALAELSARMETIGYRVVTHRGDHITKQTRKEAKSCTIPNP